jgi:hypothetical protein
MAISLKPVKMAPWTGKIIPDFNEPKVISGSWDMEMW